MAREDGFIGRLDWFGVTGSEVRGVLRVSCVMAARVAGVCGEALGWINTSWEDTSRIEPALRLGRVGGHDVAGVPFGEVAREGWEGEGTRP